MGAVEAAPRHPGGDSAAPDEAVDDLGVEEGDAAREGNDRSGQGPVCRVGPEPGIEPVPVAARASHAWVAGSAEGEAFT